jgi:hypothetical protein
MRLFGALAAALTLVGGAALARRRGGSRGATTTGHIVLFEAPMPVLTLSDTPALTIRGSAEAIERFVSRVELERLMGGYALWAAARDSTPELPGQAIGVWGRRTCKRFRRLLRERGATLDVRREPGPKQRITRLVRHAS